MLGPGQECPARAAGDSSLEQALGISSYLDSISPGPYRMVGPHPGPPQLQPPIKYSEQASERD